MKCRTNVGKFSFPKEEDKLKKWMTSLRIVRPKIVGANGPRLCIDHFSHSQFIHKNSTRKIPKPAEPFIPQFYSFSDVEQMGTKIIGKNGSFHTTLIVAMSKFEPFLNRILNVF